MEPRVSIVTLGVADLERAVSFYRDGLGWSLSGASNENIAFFKTSGTVLALHPREKLAADANTEPEGSGFSGFTLAHNVADKEQVAQVLAEAEAAGARIIKEAQDACFGAVTADTSQIPTGIFGRLPGIPTFRSPKTAASYCRIRLSKLPQGSSGR